jgi:hypothetical protein
MARWEPPNKIDGNEHVGRRLFDEPMLAGAIDQPTWGGIQITHFQETRGDEYSLDRLGRSSVDKKVLGYLTLRAGRDAKRFHKPKRFDGWAVLVARELTKARSGIVLELQASPINGAEPEDNIYHAHLLRPQQVVAELMAFRLRHLFTTYGQVERASPKALQKAPQEQSPQE